jgi:hypothetical protein
MKAIALLLVVTATLPAYGQQSPAVAQASTGQAPSAKPQPQPPPSPTSVDASRLGVSLDRIKRQLSHAQTQDEQIQDDAMKLSFTVQVVGQAPKIDLLQGFSLNGPLNYGGPTHREMLDVVTPQAYKAPVMPLSSIAYWAAQKLWQKTKKERCEEELRSYKALVMQGVSVSPPTCTQ